jgi:hypothetical protein
MVYFTLTTVVELSCLIISIICLIKDKDLVWRSMIMYLLLTCIAEFAGIYIIKNTSTQNNHWVYNIFLLSEAGFTSLMFSYLLSNYIKGKPLIIIGLTLILSFYIADLINHGFFEYNERTYTEMSIIFVFYSLYFFFLLLKDGRYIDVKYSAPFWWSVGTLFFYFGITAVNVFDARLDNVMLNGHHINFYIFRVLNVILYGCWGYSFICKKWLTTISRRLS